MTQQKQQLVGLNSRMKSSLVIIIVLMVLVVFMYYAKDTSSSRMSKLLSSNNLDDKLSKVEGGECPLERAKKDQEFFCSQVHPIPFQNDMKSYKITVVNERPTEGSSSSWNKVIIDMALMSSNDIVSTEIFRNGGFEKREVSTLVAQMKKASSFGIENPTFLDVGSNVGWFSVNMAARGYRTLSFDALRKNGHLFRTTLCQNPDLMKHVSFVNKGLSEKPGNCFVISGNDNQGDGMIRCKDENGNKPVADPGYTIRHELEMVRLDEYVKEDVFLLKIDVEGYEYHIMKSASNLFKDGKVMFFMSEVGPGMMRGAGSDPKEYIRYLLDNGYVISLHGFDGPFIDFVKGDELKPFASLHIFNIFGKRKDL